MFSVKILQMVTVPMTLLLTMDSGHVLNKRSQAITSTIFNSVSNTELKL